MKMNPECQIEKVVSKDDDRHALHHPYLDGKTLVATDGHAMAVLTIEREPADSDGHISCAEIFAARKEQAGIPQLEIKFPSCVEFPPGADTRFPNWRQILPDTRAKFLELRFNPESLLRLSEAIGSGSSIRLQIPVDDAGNLKSMYQPLIVRPAGKGIEDRSDLGLLMQMRRPE